MKRKRIVLRFSSFIAYTIFFMFFLKFYYHRVDFEKTKIFMQVFELINDEKQWKIKEIFDKTKNKNIYYYKMKWINWKNFYNQWLSKKIWTISQMKRNVFNIKKSTHKKNNCKIVIKNYCSWNVHVNLLNNFHKRMSHVACRFSMMLN